MSRRMANCVGQLPNGSKCSELVDTFIHESLGVELFSRGNRKAYLCPDCARRIYSYYEENNTWVGTFAKEPWTCSQELETMAPSYKARVEFEANNFIPTHDGTVDVEFKSPIYRNFKSLVHYSKTVERLMNSGDIVIDRHCGTHTHVGNGNFINYQNMERYFRNRDFYEAFFKPISDEMQRNPAKVRAMFGRSFGDWAEYPDWSDPTEHTNWINVQHDNTLEFRIFRFTTAEAYSAGVMFVKNLCEVLKIRFFDTITAPGWTGSEIAQAQKVGQLLARLFREYEIA